MSARPPARRSRSMSFSQLSKRSCQPGLGSKVGADRWSPFATDEEASAQVNTVGVLCRYQYPRWIEKSAVSVGVRRMISHSLSRDSKLYCCCRLTGICSPIALAVGIIVTFASP